MHPPVHTVGVNFLHHLAVIQKKKKKVILCFYIYYIIVKSPRLRDMNHACNQTYPKQMCYENLTYEN